MAILFFLEQHMSIPLSLALSAALVVAGCTLPTKAHDEMPSRESPLGELRGMSFVSWDRDGYGSADALHSLERIKGIGATWIAVTPTWYVSGLTASSISPDYVRSPSDEAVLSAIRSAQRLGLRVFLKPHVDVADGRWRGLIAPEDIEGWFRSYRLFLEHYAAIARDARVELLTVGVELKSLSGLPFRQQWVSLIDDVRRTFGGKLTYAANFDEYRAVSFWRELDLVGIDGFFPLSSAAGGKETEIVFGWQSWLADISGWLLVDSGVAGKPVMFSEIGYASQPGCAVEPWRKEPAGRVDEEEQAHAYAAALKVLKRQQWLAGMLWWNWPAEGAAEIYRNDYTPEGKKAEAVLLTAWRARPVLFAAGAGRIEMSDKNQGD